MLKAIYYSLQIKSWKSDTRTFVSNGPDKTMDTCIVRHAHGPEYYGINYICVFFVLLFKLIRSSF